MKAFTLIVLLLLSTSAVVLYRLPSPDQTIMGQWEEVLWEYEKIEKDPYPSFFNIDINQKKEITSNLFIHEAETWFFFNDGSLNFFGTKNIDREFSWKLKGRGHILQINHNKTNATETYKIVELTKDSLVLNFNTDLQVKGIVRIIFKRKI